MPATVVLSAVFGSTFMAAAALGAVGYAVATFAINLVATAVISSIIAKRAAKSAQDQSIKQIGNRVQLPPSTDNKIGVVYGTAYMKPIIIDAKISTDQQKMWYVMAFSEAMDSDSVGTFSFGDIYWGDKKLNFDATDRTKVVSWTNSDGTTETQPAGFINVYLYRDGSDVPTNTTQKAYEVLASDQIAEANRWNSSKKMTKLVFAIIEVKFNQDAGITGIAEITATVTNTLTKPGSVIKDYLTNTRYGAGLNINKINTTKLAELDTYSDETITYVPSSGTGTATAPRFRINGPVDTTQNFLANLVDMADASDSWLQWNEAVGQWSVVINRSYLDTDPTSTGIRQVRGDSIIGGIDLTPIDLNETFNSVEIQFPNTKIRDQPGYHYINISEFPNVVRNANEPDNRLSVALPYTNNIVQAQYIAARRLIQSREDLTINFTMDYSGIQVDAGDVIGIHHDRYGWGEYNEFNNQPYGKLFRVTQVQESKAADGSLYARIFASEYNDDVYDDNNIDLRDFTPSLNTGISDPTLITTPATPTITDINSVANIPNFTVNVVIPSTGTTSGMEFWYGTESSLDSGTYRLFQLEIPVGQTAFAKGSTLSLRFNNIEAGTYYIRCRAVGARTKSAFTDAVSITWAPEFISGVIGQDVIVNFTPPVQAVIRTGKFLVPRFAGVNLKAYGQVGGEQISYVDALTDSDPAFINSTWRIGKDNNDGYTTPGVVELTNVAFTLSNITATLDGGVQFPPPSSMTDQLAFVTIPVRFKDAAGNIIQSPNAVGQLFFQDQIGPDLVVNFTPPTLAVPRLGANLVPDFSGVRLKAYAQLGTEQINYSNAVSDSDPLFEPGTWRIASAANNSFTSTGVISLTNVAFTLTDITTTVDGGVLFPAPFAMNSQTAIVSIPVRYKDADGNIDQSSPAAAQLFFQDQGVQGPPGEDGINPGFIDLSASAGGFAETTPDTFSPTSIVIRASAQNINIPIPSWTVTGGTYTISTTLIEGGFNNNTITVSPDSESTVVTVSVNIDLYTKTITLPVSRQGPQGIPGEAAERGFVPLSYIPIGVDPTLATQTQLTNAWTSATSYTPIANDGGSFWYITESISTNTNLTYNGSIWIPAQLQLAGNLIAAGSITANQLNGNSIFTNRLASTNQAGQFGDNTGPGYWLAGDSGDAYFGGNVKIGENLDVEGLITAGTLIARVVDTDVIVPGAVTEGQRVFFEGTRQISAFNPQNETDPVTDAWSEDTRGLVFPTGVSIVPKVDARDGGRIFIEFSTTLYNNRGNNKNLVELWRVGNVITNVQFKKIFFAVDPNAFLSQSGMFFGTPNPRDQDHYLRLYSREFGITRDDYIEGLMVSKDFNYNNVFSWRQEDTGWDVQGSKPWYSTSTAVSHYWLLGDAGRYAHIATSATDYTAYTSSNTLPIPEYGQCQEITPISTGTVTTTPIVNGITSFSKLPYFVTRLYEENYLGKPFSVYKSNFDLFMGDDTGQVYMSRPHLLPKFVKEISVPTGTSKAQINSFALTRAASSATNPDFITVIGVGNDGRIIKSTRPTFTRQETDWVRTTSTGIQSYDYHVGKFSWTESTFGDYNLNGVASNYIYDTNNPSFLASGKQVVAVGDFGTILYSDDYGQTFSKVASGTLENLRSVSLFASPYNPTTNTYLGNQRWWVVGDNGTILNSFNGTTWTANNSLPSEPTEGGQFYTPNIYDSFQTFVREESQEEESYSFGYAYPLWSADDRVVSIGTGTVAGTIDFADIVTNTSTTAIVVSTATSALVWKRLWNLGSNTSPFVNTTATLGSRLTEPSATIGVVINDNNYIADSDNGITYQYHLVVGNMDGITGSTATFATNSYLSVTEFKR